MAIKCGRCQCYHESVADVKTCSMGGRVAVLDPPMASMSVPAGPTDGQWKFLNDLREQANLPRLPDDHRSHFTKHSISEAINDAKIDAAAANPKPSGSRHFKAADHPTIAAGYFAIPSLTGNQDLDFFQIDTPTEGNWEGFLFVKRVLGGGHDSVRTERVQRATAEQVLMVLLPPFAQQAAKERFGQEIGRCGCCGRTLTNDESRARGIGPDCWAKS